jgi:hypothetical protein
MEPWSTVSFQRRPALAPGPARNPRSRRLVPPLPLPSPLLLSPPSLPPFVASLSHRTRTAVAMLLSPPSHSRPLAPRCGYLRRGAAGPL